jgi:ABC-type transport system involved in multi-copper enzyme maturation permease subunit
VDGFILLHLLYITLMASQKLTNCCVAAIALVTAAYLSTPHSSTIARLAFGAFCLAIHSFCFLAKASTLTCRGKTALHATNKHGQVPVSDRKRA